jgi:hypothetical protein
MSLVRSREHGSAVLTTSDRETGVHVVRSHETDAEPTGAKPTSTK